MGIAGLQLAAVILPFTLFLQTSTGPAPSSARARSATDQRLEEMRRWREQLSLTGRAGGLDSWTQAEVAIWSDFIARTHLERATEEYELTPEQEKAVQVRLEQIKAEARAYWKEHLAEFQKLGKELQKLGDTRKDPAVRKESQALVMRRAELLKGQPLHARMVFPKIEELLPAAQIESSREKQRPMSPAQREEMAREMSYLREQAQEMASRTPQAPGLEALQAAASNTLLPWEAYVAEFIRVYDLDDAQQTTARSILTELQARRDQYRQDHQEQFEVLRNTEDPKERSRIFAELSPPIREMFEELKTRLDRIPRPAQQQAAAQRDAERLAATTRPAFPTSRPSRTAPVESAPPPQTQP